MISKLPKLAQRFSLAGSRMTGGVLFSIRPEFGQSIMKGSKTIEIRRRFSKSWKGKRAVFYAGEPTGAILGQADIVSVHQGSPNNIWKRFSSRIRCPREFYNDYVSGCDSVFAVELANPSPLMEPVYGSGPARYTSQPLHPPQSYVALTDQQGWSEAVSISVMLQCLHKRIRVFENTSRPAALALKERPQKTTAPAPGIDWRNIEFDLD